jgi:hypothetical protein
MEPSKFVLYWYYIRNMTVSDFDKVSKQVISSSAKNHSRANEQ